MNTTNTDIYTVDGGPVTAEVHRIGRWAAIDIIAVRPEDDGPKVTGHECRCGDLHEKATDDVDIDVIQLAPDKAVQLAHEIIRLAHTTDKRVPGVRRRNMFENNVIDHEFPSSHGREKAPNPEGGPTRREEPGSTVQLRAGESTYRLAVDLQGRTDVGGYRYGGPTP